MLSLGKLRISDIYPIVRIVRPHFYRIALKTSNLISKERFLEDMRLLKHDIENCEAKWSGYTSYEFPHEKKMEMIDIFNHYLRRNRFKGDSDVELLKKNASELLL